jgi:hypothetical protein
LLYINAAGVQYGMVGEDQERKPRKGNIVVKMTTRDDSVIHSKASKKPESINRNGTDRLRKGEKKSEISPVIQLAEDRLRDRIDRLEI